MALLHLPYSHSNHSLPSHRFDPMNKDDINKIVEDVCKLHGVSRELAFSRTQEPKCVAARRECIILFYYVYKFGPSFIGTHLGMSREAVVKVLQRIKKREVPGSGD